MAATCASTCTTQTPLQRLPNATRRPLAQAPSATVQQAVQQMERQQQQQPDGPAVAATGSRRSAILRLALLTAAGSLPLLLPVRGTMVGPRSELLLDSQLLPMPPGPIAFPRRQVDLNFAVLLMRSAYEACDDLNFVAMDEFQKRFWKLRQAEWESYLLLHSPLRIQQGQLSDPLYFDFIAYSQAAAASNLMREGKQVFEEYEEESEGKRMVTRDPSLADNALLPGLLFERHGELMYRRLVEGFRDEQYGGPLPSPPDASQEQLLVGVQQVLDIFSAKGYALKATLKPNPGCGGGGGGGGGGGSCAFTVRLQGPANLWSLQALAARRSLVYPQHDAAVVAAFLRASSRSSTCRLIWTDTGVRQEWSLA